jgi:serine/threonine protein kinase
LIVILGRYAIGESFASGGMGTVHLGRLRGAGGFSRVVAVKRLYPGYAGDAKFREMLLEEARLASRIRHPNVVSTLDVLETDKDLYVVMEYVHGVSLDRLMHLKEGLPVPIAAGIVEGVLSGLHAAHEARGEDGTPLGIVHRDVSPQNILVGADGISRLIDFGIAKAATRVQVTEPGTVKGKAAYMAPEQLLGEQVSRRADIFSSAVVLWEALTGRLLLEEHGAGSLSQRLTTSETVPPSHYRPGISASLDDLVLRALSLPPGDRFPTAEAMAVALRDACAPAAPLAIATWLREAAADDLELSDERIRLLESSAEEATGPAQARRIERDPDSTAATSSATTTIAPQEIPRRTWRRAIVGGAIVASVFVALGVRATWRQSVPAADSERSERSEHVAAVTESTPASSSADLTRLTPSPQVPALAVSAASPPGARAGTAAALSLDSSTGATPGLAKPATAHPTRHAGKAHCDPPYTVDASGRKRYDPTCF